MGDPMMKKAGFSMKQYLRLIRAFFHSFRIGNCLMGILIVAVSSAVVLGNDSLDSLDKVVPAGLAAFFLMAGGNMINDVSDASIDRTIHPTRAIPKGLFTRRFLLVWALIFYLVALFFAITVNIHCFLFVLGGELILGGYELYLKRYPLLGNFVIGLLVACVFLGAAAAVGGWKKLGVLALLGGSVNIAREIIKDIEDMEGDADRLTLPIKFGKKASARIAGGLLLGVMVLGVLPYYPLQLFTGMMYLILIAFVFAMIIFSMRYSIIKSKMSQQVLKAAMFVALMAFLFGNVL